ncbi:MAG: hypothetical protein Q4E35_04025 [Eubacteriales bacterium]|nr:hypothetical protein [Eubacteriales bacterium]
MKKMFALVLTLVLIFSLSVSAFASSVVAPIETKEETADMPKVVSGDIKIVPTEELTAAQEAKVEAAVESVEKLFSGDAEVVNETVKEVFGDDIETVKAIFGEDIESVEDINFEEITVNFVNYVEATLIEDGSVTVELEGDFSEVIAMMFVDGKWIKVNVISNEDGTFTLDIPCSGVLAIMTR